MTDRRIVYLMSGPAYMPYLVTSLYSLRKIWDGEVEVHAWPNTFEFAVRCAAKSFKPITVVIREPQYTGKNAQFLDKIKLMQTLQPGVNMYLDADTLPVRRDVLDRLFEMGECGFCATQWNTWVSNGRMVGGRIKRLLDREGIPQEYVHEALSKAYPSVNGGVFACRPESAALPLWEQWTSKVLDIFIADETTLHAVMVKFLIESGWGKTLYPKGFRVVFDVATGGGKFNSSPSKKDKKLLDDEVGIWHGHGNSFIRPDKSAKGVAMWWPIYQHCLKENIGGIADWKDDALAGRSRTGWRFRKLEEMKNEQTSSTEDILQER